MRLLPLWTFAMLFTVATATAQDRPPTAPPPVDSLGLIQLRLLDGSELVGRVLTRDDSSLTVLTATGLRAVVPLPAVAEWHPIAGRTVRGVFRRTDPNGSRLFFTATGRTLAAGQAYFADYFLFLPFVAVGFTDRIMAAAGVSLVPGATSQLLYFAPKIAVVKSPTVNFAIGAIFAAVPDEGTIGAGYGALTLGSEDNALTILLGYPFGDGIDSPGPGLVLGGEARTSRSTKLLAEMWKVPDASEVPLVVGMRIFGDRLAVDFGLMNVIGADMEGFPFIPWVDFVVNFSGGKGRRAAPGSQQSSLTLPALWGRRPR